MRFFAFELKGNVPSVVDFVEDLSDTFIVNVECVPGTTTEVSLGLYINAFRRQRFKLIVLILQEIASIGSNLQPW